MTHSGTLWLVYPWVLLGLLIIPVLAVWGLRTQQAGLEAVVQFSAVQFLEKLQSHRQALWISRLLQGLMLLAIGFCIVGLAQPVWWTRQVTHDSNLMLVLDISLSMAAMDLPPSRLEAAKKAAIAFTRDLPDGVRVGLTLFAGNTYTVSTPTENHALIAQYLNSLRPDDLRPGTAIGDALISAQKSLDAIPHPKKSIFNRPSAPGSIILLTDGENNLGVSPQQVLKTLKADRIKVSTVGMGGQGAYVQGDIYTQLDESTLQTIAQTTGGHYYRVKSFQDFQSIYRNIAQDTLGLRTVNLSLMPVCLSLAMLFMLITLLLGHRYRGF